MILAHGNTAKDGTGRMLTVFEADESNDCYLSGLTLTSRGTNIGTKVCLFLNNGYDQNDPTNNQYYLGVTLPPTILSARRTPRPIYVPCALRLLPGWKVNAALTVAVAAGYDVVVLNA